MPGRPRIAVPRAGGGPVSRKAGTGSALPFSVRGPKGESSTAPRIRRAVSVERTTSPGGAADCRRAAVLAASPMVVYSLKWSLPICPTRTRPLLMPTRTERSGPPSAATF